jgi:hypothetical protein
MAEQTKRQQLELHLAARATQDPEFREKLLGDPKQTIEEEIGLHFPLTLHIQVHEERLNELHVVLPVNLETSADLGQAETTSSASGPGGERPSLPFWKKTSGKNRP